MEEKSPHKRENKAPQMDCFPGGSGGGGRRLLLPPPCARAPMNECDYKMHNNFGNCSPLILYQNTLECTQLYYLKKKLEEHTLESCSNEIEQRCIRTAQTTTQAGYLII